jgi:hypothetical protein
MLKKEFKSILWEYDIKELDYTSDLVFIRSLTMGERNHINYLKKKLWNEDFKKKFLKNIASLDKKTINYWGIVLSIDTKKYLTHTQTTYEKLNEPIFTRNFR